MSPAARRSVGVIVLVTVAVACWLIVGWSGSTPGYDSAWHLVWGDQLIHGRSPTFDSWAAPTEHPLLLAIASATALAGRHSTRLFLALELLALVALMPVLASFGRTVLESSPSGLIGWLALIGPFGLLLGALHGWAAGWIWFLLLVSLTLLASSHGRTALAALPLGLAGLLRPEAWLLALLALALHWRGLSNRDRTALAAAALVPPLVCLGIDGIVTGNPFLSLETTKSLALEEAGGGPWNALATSLFGGIRGPVTALGVIGLVLAIRTRGTRPVAELLAVGGVGLLTTIVIAASGRSILPRYLLLTELALSLLAGYAISGWAAGEPTARNRRVWALAGLAAAAIGIAGIVLAGAPGRFEREVKVNRSVQRDLKSLLAAPATANALRCGPLTFPSIALVPEARLIVADDSVSVRARSQPPGAPSFGVAVAVISPDPVVRGRYSHPGVRLPVDEAIPAGFTKLAATPNLIAWGRCPGAA